MALWLRIALLLLVTQYNGVVGFFGKRNGDMRLLGSSPDYAVANTTVKGICNVTSISITSRPDFNASRLIITDFQGNPLPQDTLFLNTETSIHFVIHNIAMKQYGKYKCYYINSNSKKELIYDRWIYVGVRPMKPQLPPEGILVSNWENMTIEISPTIAVQNAYTHDERDTASSLATKCKIWFNWSCSKNMEYIECVGMTLYETKCVVTRGTGTEHFRDLSGPKPPNYICIKASCWNAYGNSTSIFKRDLAQRVKEGTKMN